MPHARDRGPPARAAAASGTCTSSRSASCPAAGPVRDQRRGPQRARVAVRPGEPARRRPARSSRRASVVVVTGATIASGAAKDDRSRRTSRTAARQGTRPTVSATYASRSPIGRSCPTVVSPSSGARSPSSAGADDHVTALVEPHQQHDQRPDRARRSCCSCRSSRRRTRTRPSRRATARSRRARRCAATATPPDAAPDRKR